MLFYNINLLKRKIKLVFLFLEGIAFSLVGIQSFNISISYCEINRKHSSTKTDLLVAHLKRRWWMRLGPQIVIY